MAFSVSMLSDLGRAPTFKGGVRQCQSPTDTIGNHIILKSSVNAIRKAMTNMVFFGTKFRGGQSFVFTVGDFFNKRE